MARDNLDCAARHEIGKYDRLLVITYFRQNFGTYNTTYGSLDAVIGLMTWLWISFTIIILEAELNSEIGKAAGELHAALAHAGR